MGKGCEGATQRVYAARCGTNIRALDHVYAARCRQVDAMQELGTFASRAQREHAWANVEHAARLAYRTWLDGAMYQLGDKPAERASSVSGGLGHLVCAAARCVPRATWRRRLRRRAGVAASSRRGRPRSRA